MDFPTPPRDRKALFAEATTSTNATRGTGTPDSLIINSQPGYPNHIATSRYFRDAQSAADVRRLVWATLSRRTDGRLHFGGQGTFLVLQKSPQAELWDTERSCTAPLTDLIAPLTHWLSNRVKIVRGSRNIEARLAKSDEALNELGFASLRRTLLGLAGRKRRQLQILDAAGHGGILDIPPRGELIPASKIEVSAPSDGTVEVIGIEPITQVIGSAGTLVEAPADRVSDRIAEGGHAHVRHPRSATIRAQRARHVEVIQDRQGEGRASD